jgi:hypothetical protein
MIGLGTYPATPLADARMKRGSARSLLEAGIDPSAQRRESKAAETVAASSTFGVVAAEVLANKEANEAASATLSKNRWLLENLAAPLAARPIAEITAAEILELLRRVEKSDRRESAPSINPEIGGPFAARESCAQNPPRPAGQRRFDDAMKGHAGSDGEQRNEKDRHFDRNAARRQARDDQALVHF